MEMKKTKETKKTKAYIGGTFDLMHHGHVELFRKAKEIADIVIVSLNTDEFNLEYKGRKPIMSLEERIRVVSSCKYVDIVDVNEGGQDSKPTILRHMPDFILHGQDWVEGKIFLKQLSIDKKFLEKFNIKIVYVPLVEGISTTELRKRTKSQKEKDVIQKFKPVDKKTKTARKKPQ